MSTDTRPILLTVAELRKPIALAQAKLDNAAEIETDGLPFVLLYGLFVMCVSAFEIMINDVLECYYMGIPGNLPADKISLTKEEWLNDNTISLQVNKTLHSLGYERTELLMRRFCETLSIDLIEDGVIDSIIEIKETRNALLHAALQGGKPYFEKTRSVRRITRVGQKLQLDGRYVSNAIGLFRRVSEDLDRQIVQKYGSYTKLQMLRGLWDYLFDSPILAFDDWWAVDEKADRVLGYKKNEYEDQISDSERMFVGLWRAHFSGTSDMLSDFNVNRLDAKRHAQMVYFLSILDGISLA